MRNIIDSRILEAFFVSLWAIFAPIHASIISVFVLIFSDLITGILAARKRKEPITSAGLRRTITKLFVYETAMMLGFISEKYLLGGLLPVSKLVAAMAGIVELKSIFENMDELSGQNLLGSILAKLNSTNLPK
jgi:hypothetical protein